MMEKTLILKHISRMLCLLISYSKFTRTTDKEKLVLMTQIDYNRKEYAIRYGLIKKQKMRISICNLQ